MKLVSKVKLLTAAIALTGAVYAPQASAAGANLGTLAVPGSIGFSSGSLTAGSFSDWFDFKVASLATIIGTGNAIKWAPTEGVILTSFDLYHGNHTSLIATGVISSSGGIFTSSLITYTPLAADHLYSLQVGGQSYSVGSNYSASLSTAPVPEPGSFAMLLAGLGLMGFVAKRRVLK